MESHTDQYLSIRVTRFYMKVIGFWYAKNQREQWILHATLAYTISAFIFAHVVEGTDLYYSWGNFEAITDNICVTTPLLVIAFKVFVFMSRREAVFDLITFTQNNFWNATYDKFGILILKQCEKRGIIMLFTLSFSVQGTLLCWLVAPVFENYGKNETDRVLPYRLWVDLPVKITPYYEITYMIQTLSSIHSGICFFCFDNLMGILNIHVSGQFKILQHRLENLCEEYINDMNDRKAVLYRKVIDTNHRNKTVLVKKILTTQEICAQVKPGSSNHFDPAEKTYEELKKCIKQHQVLIEYVGKLEYVFNVTLLCQMGMSSLLMCVGGYQIFIARRWLYIFHFPACLFQILIYTYTCNEIMEQSLEVGRAAYRSKWYMMPNTKAGYSVRRALMMVMIRARNACYLSAGKFIPISLQTCTSVLSTTMSYLSLLCRVSEGF